MTAWPIPITRAISPSSTARRCSADRSASPLNYNYVASVRFAYGRIEPRGQWVEQVSGVTIIQDGTPITIADSSAGTIYGTAGSANQAGFSRAQMCPGMTYGNIATPGGVEARLGGNSGGPGYFNSGAFCPAPTIGDGTGYGDSGSGIILGPGQFNWDISILKDTRIRENHLVQFRAEFFNAFNHPQFSNPNFGQGAIFSASPTGLLGELRAEITSTSVEPPANYAPFALKYVF